MTKQIIRLNKLLGTKKNKKSVDDLNAKLLSFELENGVLIPSDLAEYFKLLNSANKGLDKDLYEFYSFGQVKSVKNGLAFWRGIPDYGNIINTLKECENCFVFAHYQFHLFTYAIRLYQSKTDVNEAYMICGDKYKIVANSFSDFLELYFDNSMELTNI